MHVAMLSWRDAGNPEAGGAERYLTRVATGLVDRGHDVSLLTAAYPGAPPREQVDGVQVRRTGGKLSVYPTASLALSMGRVGRVDIVVDVQNGVPFFSRLGTRRPVVVLVHHVHREQWPVVYGPVGARLGWWVESTLAPLTYRTSEYVTVSEHTRRELASLGVDPRRITVVHNGTDSAPGAVARSTTPRLICLGRLVPHKQVEHALRLVHQLRREWPQLHLDIVGDGWWRDHLHTTSAKLGLERHVTFHGHVSEQDKHAILARSWVNVLPSLKEGWGLSVVEAAAHGVPTVGYRTAGGLTDSVVDGETGLLVDDEAGLRSATSLLLADTSVRQRLGMQAHERSRRFTWDETVTGFEEVLKNVLAREALGR